MPNRLTDLDVRYVSLVDRAAVRDPSHPSDPQRFLLTKSEIPVADLRRATLRKEAAMPDELEAERKRAEKAERKLAKAEAKLQKARKKSKKAKKPKMDDDAKSVTTDSDDSGDKMSKREKIRKAERDEALQRAAKAEKIAKEERDLRVVREFVEKARTDFPNLGPAEELGEHLMAVSEKLSKSEMAGELKLLAVANEQIGKGALFSELGHGGESPANGKSDLERSAQKLRKADPALSSYEAMRAALRSDPDLQARVLNGEV